MDISIIIPAYNEASEIGACLESVIACGKGRFKEIVVVDNASTDNTSAVAGGYAGVRVVHEPKKGLPNARQCGLEATTSELVAYIDADTHLTPEWFDTAERLFKENPGIVALSGPRRYFGTTALRTFVLDALWWPTPLVYKFVGYMILGGNFIARRDALQKIGGFDRSIQFYGEDTDIARRLSTVGKVLFSTQLYVYASARRFDTEGMVKPHVTYALNYLWPVIFKKPYSPQHVDVR